MFKIMLKTFFQIVCVSIISVSVSAAEFTLRFAHFWPPVSAQHKQIAQVWADKVMQESNGRIKVEIYPSGTLAKPPAHYDAVKNRIADIAFVVQGYTANRFPLTQIIELPGLVNTGVHGSCVLQSIYNEGFLNKEYKDTKPLFLFTHGQGHIHTNKALVKTPADLKGKRIRQPSAVVAKMIQELGGKPVGMPAPQAYQSMQRGVIDGITFPWEAMLVFRMNELAKYHTEVGGLYALAFAATMNKSVYNNMPDDLKKVIDNNSGLEWAKIAAQVFDNVDSKARQEAIDAGHEIYTVEGGIENPEWKPVLEGVTEGYLKQLEGRGLDARKVYQRIVELSPSCES
jgi:TRAP-type C4-dicarboxylate transport system substrate-binding protein